MIFFTHKFDVFWYKQTFLSQDPWKLWVHFTSFHLILFHSDVGPLAIYEFSWWIKLPHVLSGGWSHLTNKGIFQKPLGVPKKNIGRWMKVHEHRSDNEQYPPGWPSSQYESPLGLLHVLQGITIILLLPPHTGKGENSGISTLVYVIKILKYNVSLSYQSVTIEFKRWLYMYIGHEPKNWHTTIIAIGQKPQNWATARLWHSMQVVLLQHALHSTQISYNAAF